MTASHILVAVGWGLVKTNESSSISRFYQPRLLCPITSLTPLKPTVKQCGKLICIVCMNFDHDDHRGDCKYLEKVAKQEMESLQAC